MTSGVAGHCRLNSPVKQESSLAAVTAIWVAKKTLAARKSGGSATPCVGRNVEHKRLYSSAMQNNIKCFKCVLVLLR